MPVRMDAIGTWLPRPALVLAASLLLLPVAGCFNLRQPLARGSAVPLLPLPMTKAQEPPPDIARPPAPTMPKVEATPTNRPKIDGADSPLTRLGRQAIEREKLMSNYIVRMRRREQVNGKSQPEEIILLKYRRAPLSVHCKWLGDEGRGREIVYVQGQHDDKIHLLTGKGDFLGAGRKLSFTPDSPLVRSQSRYPVTEAGLGAATLRFGQLMSAIERGQTNAGSAKYLGLVNRPEFPMPVEAVEQAIPPGLEAFLPRGGTRFFYFDESIGVPTVVYTLDPNKQEAEYYHFDRLQSPINLDDRDFDPNELWKR